MCCCMDEFVVAFDCLQRVVMYCALLCDQSDLYVIVNGMLREYNV